MNLNYGFINQIFRKGFIYILIENKVYSPFFLSSLLCFPQTPLVLEGSTLWMTLSLLPTSFKKYIEIIKDIWRLQQGADDKNACNWLYNIFYEIIFSEIVFYKFFDLKNASYGHKMKQPNFLCVSELRWINNRNIYISWMVLFPFLYPTGSLLNESVSDFPPNVFPTGYREMESERKANEFSGIRRVFFWN